MRRILMMMAVAGLLAACGGGDDETGQEPASSDSGGDADDYIEPLAASIPEGEDGLPVDDEQATCMATALVDLIGVDALREADVSPDELVATEDFTSLGVELPPDATASLGADLAACDIAEALETLLISPFDDEFGVALPAEGATCLAENMDDQAVADGFAEALLEGTDTSWQATLGAAMGACPSVASMVFISQAPVELSAEAQACVTTFIAGADPALMGSVFSSGGGNSAAAEQLGTQLAAACPEYAGG
jgi:hypothetical protein